MSIDLLIENSLLSKSAQCVPATTATDFRLIGVEGGGGDGERGGGTGEGGALRSTIILQHGEVHKCGSSITLVSLF